MCPLGWLLRLPDSYDAKIAKNCNLDILKAASVGGGEVENLKACHFSPFNFSSAIRGDSWNVTAFFLSMDHWSKKLRPDYLNNLSLLNYHPEYPEGHLNPVHSKKWILNLGDILRCCNVQTNYLLASKWKLNLKVIFYIIPSSCQLLVQLDIDISTRFKVSLFTV